LEFTGFFAVKQKTKASISLPVEEMDVHEPAHEEIPA
jgi:hypothetical protein